MPKAFHSANAPMTRHQPTGCVAIKGAFAKKHRDELLLLIRELEERVRAEHPAQQIIVVEERAGKLLITTAGAHLAREIGKALEQAFQGKANYSFSTIDRLLEVRWRRD